jgi:fucose permease
MISLLLPIIYLSFISLGLPDALLGAAWPIMCVEFDVPVSYAGIISIIGSGGTIISSLLSDRLTRRFGTAKVTAFSVAMTALALFGYSVSDRYWMLLLWAIPYGLGAGSVDASINNYVALHYASRHMSWLHCMWGVGASVGPYIMGYALTGGQGWNAGYRYIAILQVVLSAVLLLSVPLWKKRGSDAAENSGENAAALSLREIFGIRGAKEILLAFFCYCALEGTAGLWAATYMVRHLGMDEETAARLASIFYLGITGGRAVSGFLTYKFNDAGMIRMGQAVIAAGVAAMVLPLGETGALVGILLIGLGCAPIYPSIIHSTPEHFGAENAQAIIGVQMASAYVGFLAAPPAFGLIANHISASLLPLYLGVSLVVMAFMCERLNRMKRSDGID